MEVISCYLEILATEISTRRKEVPLELQTNNGNYLQELGHKIQQTILLTRI